MPPTPFGTIHEISPSSSTGKPAIEVSVHGTLETERERWLETPVAGAIPIFAKSVSSVVDSVKQEIARLDELREVLECAEVEVVEQEKVWRERQEWLEASRQRHLQRLQRFRGIRGELRQREAAKRLESSNTVQELEKANARLADAMAMLESARDLNAITQGEHRTELDALQEQLEMAVKKAEQAETRLAESKSRLTHLSSELEQACEQIILLDSQLESVQSGGSPDSDDQAIQAELRAEIELLKKTCQGLESENASLASEIADLRVRATTTASASSQAVESMTWEQRKAAILAQLHQEESAQSSPNAETQSLREMIEKTSEEVERRDQEIAELRELLDQQSATFNANSGEEDVAIGAAGIAMMFDSDELICEERDRLKEVQAEWDAKLRQAEVERRDREIAELRELLDQQSATFNANSGEDDVAIGAAGIAMMFDSDELICEERDRLKEVQAEWDAKLRQAEVELSLERAKMARERRDLEMKQNELEEKLRQFELDQTPSQQKDDGKTPRRRWLTQLGLNDGS